MKIALLTYHSSRNYGANLQAYSTYSRLSRDGYEPILIDWDYFKAQPCSAQGNVHRRFVEERMALTNPCKTSREIAAELERLGIENVLIGSDALVNVKPFLKWFGLSRKTLLAFRPPDATARFPNPFWGDFSDYMQRPPTLQMMSVSSQNADYRKYFSCTKRAMGNRLLKFKYVSVRDTWTRDMLSNISSGKVVPALTPDPVFAFGDNALDLPPDAHVLEKYGLEPGKYVLLGFREGVSPNSDWVEKFSGIVRAEGLVPAMFPMPAKLGGADYIFKNPPEPLEWYILIKNARAYVGNNMHPLVICIHNGVAFYSFDQYGIRSIFGAVDEAASKTYDLLSKAGLLDFRARALAHCMQIPSPEVVWQKICGFDYGGSAKAALQKRREYFAMIGQIESNFRG